MKVISRGIPEWKKEVTCRRCNSVLEIGENDVKCDRDEDEDEVIHNTLCKAYRYYAYCGVCGHDIYLGYTNPVTLKFPNRQR